MKYSYCIAFFCSFLCLTSFAQNDSSFLKKATTSLSNYTDSNPAEKVYLHLDRQNYYPGDTIWFKAYNVAGAYHKLSAISGVLYCELINSSDSVVLRRVFKLVAGLTWGDFTLSRSYKPGIYHIRAYTNWMRNAGAEYFYNQPVRILGPVTDVRMSVSVHQAGNQKADGQPDVQFFPEGGGLVDGLRSRVAVKAVNSAGLGEDVSGTITDDEGNDVAAFTTQHLGMGVFAFTPQAGKKYKAQVITLDSVKFSADLPAVGDEGFVLTLNNNNPDSIYLKVAANNKLFSTRQNEMFYVVVQSAGKVYYTTQSKLSAPVFTVAINKNRFPTGVVQFTLFSQSGNPLNERIVFIQNEEGLNIKLSESAVAHITRQKVKIGIDVKKDTARSATGSLSVAVINESRVPINENSESTILNNLLLTSDLKGYIEQPNYYFTDINDQKRADLDLLMLTQGYRRFEWKQVWNDKPSVMAYKPETDLSLEGTLKTPSGTPLPKGKITLLATRDAFVADTTTDINGIFKFTGLNLSDTAKIVLRARRQHNGSNVAIYVKQPEYPAIIKSNKNQITGASGFSPGMVKNIEEYNKRRKEDSLKNSRDLQEVKIVAKNVSPKDRFNAYGTVAERNLNMAGVREYQTIRQAVYYLAPRFKDGKIVIDGVEMEVDPNYSWDEIQSIRLIDPNGFDLKTGRFNEAGYIYVTTKRYAGTDTVMLKEVVITAKKINKPDLSRSSNLHGGGNADQVIMGDKMGDCILVSDCLTGRAFGITFANGVPVNNRNGGTMSVIVDGVILSSSSLNDINKSDIYSIEVLRSAIARSIYGSSIEKGGALVITTRMTADPKYVTSTTPAGLITYPFLGYHLARVFYSPKYDHPKTDAERFDARSTIYWNPNIITDKNGKASFEYYNADTKGTYRVVIEGIDDDGRIGRAVYRYKVE